MSTEAMKLALEALEFNDRRFDIDNYPDKGTIRSVGQEAITALQEAQAQPHQEPVAWQYRDANDDGTWSAWLGCDKRLVEDEYRQVRALFTSPQPAPVQQEPVAWMHEWEDGEKIPMLKGRDDRNQDKPKTVRPLVYGDTSPPAQPQQEPVAWVLLRQDEDGLEPIQFYGGKQKPEGDFKDRFTLRPVCFADAAPPAQRKPLTDGIPSPDELEALSDGNSGMIFNAGFPTKLDKLACWLREYAAIEAAHNIKEST